MKAGGKWQVATLAAAGGEVIVLSQASSAPLSRRLQLPLLLRELPNAAVYLGAFMRERCQHGQLLSSPVNAVRALSVAVNDIDPSWALAPD